MTNQLTLLEPKTCSEGHTIDGNNALPYKQSKSGKTYYSCRICNTERKRIDREKSGEFLPPDTKTVMASYKEPLKPVPGGFGYYGTISYDETKKYTQCHLCGNFYKVLGNHVSKIHDKSARQYRIEMGLPVTISLNAPNHRSGNHVQWAAYSTEKRASIINKLKQGRVNTYKNRQKTLYQKNLEGRCPDQLLDKILQLKEKLGYTPSRREFNKEFSGFAGSVELTFGSWSEAIKILNLVPRKSGIPTHMQWDKETLLKLLFDFRKVHTREPMVSDCDKGLLPSVSTYIKYFGSWSKAKEYVL